MNIQYESKNQIWDCQVFGAAIEQTSKFLGPFIKDEQLKAAIAAIKTEQDLRSWYPVAILVDMLEIAVSLDVLEQLARAASMNLLAVMRDIPGIDTPKKALHTIEDTFPKQHHGNPGHLTIKMLGHTTAEITDASYAPCGYTIALCQMAISGYGARKDHVDHPPDKCRKNGSSACTYTLFWEED